MIKDPETEKWLAKKNKKNLFWQVKIYLNNLRIPFKEFGKDAAYYMEVPLFGMRFRFNGTADIDDYGWDVYQIDQNKLEKEPCYFGESLMWDLVKKGLFAYLRESGSGEMERIFKSLVIDGGWGTRILEKRLELYGNDKRNTFLKMRTTGMLNVSLSRILSLNPGAFDYLT
jgi:hypothetical protein